MPPAIIGGAIAAVGAVGGSVLAGGAAKSAANTAAASADRTAAANNALARDIYGQNKSALSPFMTRGNAAGEAINALLGLAPANGNTASTSPDYTAYVEANPDLLAEYGRVSPQFGTEADYGRFHYDTYGRGEGRSLPSVSIGGVAPQSTQNAFEQYRNSTGYQFRMDQGQKAMNALAAANGSFDSGAAVKSALSYGQGIGSQEFGNYLGYLSNQQGVGLSGASALAGVGQNYVNTVGANNNSAGSAAASAALIRGSANAGTYEGIAGALGRLGSSFGAQRSSPSVINNYGSYGSFGEW